MPGLIHEALGTVMCSAPPPKPLLAKTVNSRSAYTPSVELGFLPVYQINELRRFQLFPSPSFLLPQLNKTGTEEKGRFSVLRTPSADQQGTFSRVFEQEVIWEKEGTSWEVRASLEGGKEAPNPY